MKNESIYIRLTQAEKQRIRAFCAVRGMDMSETVRRAIETYIEARESIEDMSTDLRAEIIKKLT